MSGRLLYFLGRLSSFSSPPVPLEQGDLHFVHLSDCLSVDIDKLWSLVDLTGFDTNEINLVSKVG